MAQRKIIWSHRAKIKLQEILNFYIDRNTSATYSKKLYKKINKEIKLLANHPNLGFKTDDESIRGLIIDNYILFYEVNSDKIIIHTVWDCHKNPEDLTVR